VPLPVVDEEYIEMVATFQSVLRARLDQPYVVAEFGARWGTWATRAVAFLRRRRPELAYRMHMAEAYRPACEAIEVVARLNGFVNYTVECGRASGESLRRWLADQGHVDLIDFDIEGGEHAALREAAELLEEKVYRITVATHQPAGTQLHEQTKGFLLSRGHQQSRHAPFSSAPTACALPGEAAVGGFSSPRRRT